MQELENQNAGQEVETATTDVSLEEQTENEDTSDGVEKTFTQEQVNNIMRTRLERDRNAFFKRYGVENRDGLDALIGKSQSYDIMKERYEVLKDENANLKERLTFISNNINPDREDDIKAYFKGKEIELNEDNLLQALATHPEWLKVVAVDNTPKTTIQSLGVEHGQHKTFESEEEKMKRIYGI